MHSGAVPHRADSRAAGNPVRWWHTEGERVRGALGRRARPDSSLQKGCLTHIRESTCHCHGKSPSCNAMS